MIIYNSLDHIDEKAKGSVVAIGNFDGVHRGHQALLNKAKEIAQAKQYQTAALTFEPHPRKLFQPGQPAARLTPPSLKAKCLQKHGVDYLFSLPFNWDFASQTADDFIQHILKDNLAAAHIIVGFNFCFGQLRQGGADTIRAAGLPIDEVTAIQDEKGEDISSSRIRQYLRKGQLKEANHLLGWDWVIEGEIIRGDRRGHELGYPTANILLKETLHPAYGVYACLVQIEGETQWRQAATNIGIRPMFEIPEGQVEAHILDFPDKDIYGKKLRVQPVQRLRSEAKFDSLDALIAQMDKDCQATREILAK